jgi:hypothetical protein
MAVAARYINRLPIILVATHLMGKFSALWTKYYNLIINVTLVM